MAGRGGAVAAAQQPEPVVQPGRDLRHRQGPQPRRGQLQGQRQPVEGAADPQHRRGGVGVEGEPGRHVGGPVGEQPHRRVRGRRLRCARRVRDGQAADRAQRLTGEAQRLPAGGQHPQPGSGGEQPGGQPGRVVDDVLAVVEHQQQAPAGQRRHQPVGAGRRGPPGAAQPGVAQVQRGQHRRRDRRAGRHRGQLHQAHRPVVPGRRGGGQPGLAGAAGPVQRHQPRRGEQLLDAPQLPFPADEAGQRGGQARRRRGVVAQQRGVQRDQLRRRVGAQLLGQHAGGRRRTRRGPRRGCPRRAGRASADRAAAPAADAPPPGPAARRSAARRVARAPGPPRRGPRSPPGAARRSRAASASANGAPATSARGSPRHRSSASRSSAAAPRGSPSASAARPAAASRVNRCTSTRCGSTASR